MVITGRMESHFACAALLALILMPGCGNPFSKGDSTPPPQQQRYSNRKQEKTWWKPTSWMDRSDKSTHVQKEEPRFVEKTPPKQTSKFSEATELVNQHKFQQASEMFEQILAEEPNNSEAFRWLGDCYYNLMRLDDAIKAYSAAREKDSGNYYALRGKGFAHLHLGHEYWRSYEDSLKGGDRARAHENLSEAHENYKRSLEILQHALKVFPADSEAMYGRAMAAEGASRKLYANAVGLLRKGERERAHAWAENCLEIIDEGIEASKIRIQSYPDRAGPRKLAGGMFLRRAKLLKEFGETAAAIGELRKAAQVQESIIKDIDPENVHAKREIAKCEKYLTAWQAELEKKSR